MHDIASPEVTTGQQSPRPLRPDTQSLMVSSERGGRQSGRDVLRRIIMQHRDKADQLQKLVDMLPSQPTPEQDEALWNIAVSMQKV